MKTCVAILLFAASSGWSQTPPDSSKILQELLTEVRQLRQALERSASVAGRLQLTLQRLQFQQEQVTHASRQLEDLRNQMAKLTSDEARALARLKILEAQPQERDEARRKEVENAIKAVKVELEQQSEQGRLQEAQMRARESELTSRLYAEQGKLNELNDRFDALERLLEAPQPKQP